MQTIEQQLSKVDINLLIVFQVLMQKGSVTKAADHLFISQPAMSGKLQHLRELFDDPLFVRTPQGVTPTPKAMQLLAPVNAILAQLSTLILQPVFTPEQAVGDISIQIPDSFSIALIPALYRRLRRSAPQLKLTSDNTTEQHLDLLARGRADFSVYVADDYGSDFMTYALGTSSTVCWMRSDHPLEGNDTVAIDDVLKYPLAELTFSPPTSGSHLPTETIKLLMEINALHHLDAASKVGSTQLLTLLSIVLETDTLLLGAPYLSRFISPQYGLTYRPVAEYIDLRIPFVLIQHRRTETSPVHSWLREQIIDCWPQV